jgi:hypothetical protein
MWRLYEKVKDIMSATLSERRWAENQTIFKQVNEEAAAYFRRDSSEEKSLQFYCECADENCRQRIALTPSEYLSLHRSNKQFILIPGHQLDVMETVLLEETDYVLTEKYESPPKGTKSLNRTTLNNASKK